eukprot:jgi/Tetstr1/465001/TSEL_009732.t1
MHAYNADMQAARHEAAADIEWPELDSHHGIPVLNVLLGMIATHMAGFWLRNGLPSEVEGFAEAVDNASDRTAVERVLARRLF